MSAVPISSAMIAGQPLGFPDPFSGSVGWRARYGDEVHALLQESGGLRDVASLAWRALPA